MSKVHESQDPVTFKVDSKLLSEFDRIAYEKRISRAALIRLSMVDAVEKYRKVNHE